MAQHDDDFEQADRSRCIIEKLKAALPPGGASEYQDSPPGTTARALAIWGSLSFGARCELVEALDRQTVAALYAEETRTRQRVIEV